MAGYTWADIGTARMPFDQFVAFVCHAPPGTAIYHELSQGWSVIAHLLTDLLEVNDLLLWSKTKDAQKNRRRPKRRPRPGIDTGQKKPSREKPQFKADVTEREVMTVADYVARTGMKINLEGR